VAALQFCVLRFLACMSVVKWLIENVNIVRSVCYSHTIWFKVEVCVCACTCVCARVCACVSVRVCVCVCVHHITFIVLSYI